MDIDMDFVQTVFDKIPIGRVASWVDGEWGMAKHIQEAGPGDYIEFGTLFGGSLIIAALAKLAAGEQEFQCYGVDPFEGYYTAGRLDPITKEEVTLMNAQTNIDYFGVQSWCTLVPFTSNELPEIFLLNKYRVVYIDGGHSGEQPLHDWKLAQKIAEPGSIVMFDNIGPKYPGVEVAADAATKNPDWETIDLIHNGILVVRRLR